MAKVSGYFLGFFLPPLVAITVGFGNYIWAEDYAVLRAFYACFATTLILTAASFWGWRKQKPYWRGVTFGAALWLLVLPAVSGQCTQIGWLR